MSARPGKLGRGKGRRVAYLLTGIVRGSGRVPNVPRALTTGPNARLKGFTLAPAAVWVVSLEWNQPTSEQTGDPGVEGLFFDEQAARDFAHETRADLHTKGHAVINYSHEPGSYCALCGEEQRHATPKAPHRCTVPSEADDAFCDCCGAELTDNGSCDNDHDDWDVDVHVGRYEVKA